MGLRKKHRRSDSQNMYNFTFQSCTELHRLRHGSSQTHAIFCRLRLINIYGCTSKFKVRINPQNPQAIQTPDPDLRSRPIQTSRSRPMIQTPCFILFGFVDPDPLFYFGVNMLDPAPSLPLWLDCGLEGHAV